MACSTPFDALRLATESLGPDLYSEASYRSIALNLIPREEYPAGTGLTQSVFTIARSEPTTDTPAFSAIALTSGEDYTGSCGTTYSDVPVGLDENTYSPEQFGWQGPVVCQDDLIYNFKSASFWQKYIPAMAKNTEQTIANRLFAIYDHYVPKSVANEDFNTVDGGTGAPPQAPVLTLDQSLCDLSQEMLDTVAAELNEEGASQPDSSGWINLGEDGPIYPLYIGQQESQRLQLVNSELRADYRNAYMGAGESNPLLKRIGATRVIRSFRHVINLFPPRYTYSAGAYTRVPTWTMPSATKGQKATINPAWRAAGYEGARVLSPWVFHDQLIRPVNSAAGMNWKPKNYMGNWMFVVGGNKIGANCADPLEKLGRHFAEFKHAAKPIFPKFGRLIIFKRCPSASYTCVTCS